MKVEHRIAVMWIVEHRVAIMWKVEHRDGVLVLAVAVVWHDQIGR